MKTLTMTQVGRTLGGPVVKTLNQSDRAPRYTFHDFGTARQSLPYAILPYIGETINLRVYRLEQCASFPLLVTNA